MKEDIKKITEQLEQGVKDIFESDGYKQYLDFMGKFYHYSVNNIILIMLQKPEATFVAGYKKWNDDFDRHVRKGETSIKILAPIFKKVKVEQDGEEKEIQKLVSFKTASVFDISQTEGKDIPSFINTLTGEVENYEELIEKLKKVSPVPVGFETMGKANGYFHIAEKRIAIKEGMSEQQTIKTMIHEIAHAILHDREAGEEKSADGNTREVQAESVAYTVCNMLGLDTSDYSFGYVAGWSNGKEVKELNASMEVIRKTAEKIIDALQEGGNR